MKTLLVYYSYTGNTELLVNKIKEKINCDIIRLDTIKPYNNYEYLVEQAKIDVENNYQPELINEINLDNYDTILLGSPVWWYTFSSPINTFLNKYNLSNKVIIPFITNAGWLGHTIEDIKKICPNVKDEISIKFNEDKLLDEIKFDEWLKKLEMER